MTAYPKIDVHHHLVPPELQGVQAGLKGMAKIEWTLTQDKQFSKSIGIGTAMLSVSTPGVTHISDPEESASLARSMNKYSAKIRDENPKAYGFFATIPSPGYTELALRELSYAFDDLHADGVTLFTRYGPEDRYLGHEDFVPIWEELNRRKAVVFVHPIDNKHGELFNEHIQAPAFDWPHETGRTAMDLILHRRMQQFQDVKIILSHGGGTLPLLARRSTLISLPQFGSYMTADDIMDQAKRFYFDLALSGSSEILPLILGFAPKNHLLFGSDFPHCPGPMGHDHAKFIDAYEMSDEKRKEVYFGAAEKLFPRLTSLYNEK